MPRNSHKTSLNTNNLPLEEGEDVPQTTTHQESDGEKTTTEDMVCFPLKKRIIKKMTNENSAPSTQSEIAVPSLITLATATTTLSAVDSPSENRKRNADLVFTEKTASEPASPSEKRRVLIAPRTTKTTSVEDDLFDMQEIAVDVKHKKTIWRFVYHKKGDEFFFNDTAVAQLLGVNQNTLRGRLVQLAKEHTNGRLSGKEQGFPCCFNTVSLVNEAIFSWPKEGQGPCFHINLDQTKMILKAAQIPFYNVANYLQMVTASNLNTFISVNTTISTTTKRKRESSPTEFNEQGCLIQHLSPVSSPRTPPTPHTETETELELEQFIFDISAYILLQLNADYLQLIDKSPRAT